MMDTPGFSSMFIDCLEPGELKDYFPEFGPYEEECKFLGCVHVGRACLRCEGSPETGRTEPQPV